MATPSALTGASKSLEIDGTDILDFGCIIEQLQIPAPPIVRNSSRLANADGEIDFGANYGPRRISCSGYIKADSIAGLKTNIDGIAGLIHLKPNNDFAKLIFTHQSDRFYKAKYSSFSTTALAKWRIDTLFRFNLEFICYDPFGYSTSLTTTVLNIRDAIATSVTNSDAVSNFPTINMEAFASTNLIENVVTTESTSSWGTNNCSLATNSSGELYQTVKIVATQTAGGAFFADADITSQLTLNQDYSISIWVEGYSSVELGLDIDGVVDAANKDVSIAASGAWIRLHVNFTATDDPASSTYKLRITEDGTRSTLAFDGAALSDATQFDFFGRGRNQEDFIPPAFVSGTSTINVVNPNIKITNKNLFEFGDGNDTTDWTFTSSGSTFLSIPESFADKDVLGIISDGTSNLSFDLVSPKIFVARNTQYTLSFNYYNPSGNTSNIALSVREVDVGGTTTSQSGGNLLNKQSGYVKKTFTFTTAENTEFIQIRFEMSVLAAGEEVFFKDFQVETGSSATTYLIHKSNVTTITRTMNDKDRIVINSKDKTVDFYDASAKTLTNDISNHSGDFPEFYPGVNHFIFFDDRSNANLTASSASVDLTFGFEKRFL